MRDTNYEKKKACVNGYFISPNIQTDEKLLLALNELF